jgi:hypothetical protein
MEGFGWRGMTAGSAWRGAYLEVSTVRRRAFRGRALRVRRRRGPGC